MLDTERAGPRQASAYLRLLLERPGAYRSMWRGQLQRERPAGGINQDAVARVLTAYQERVGEGSGSGYRGLNDTVRRALSHRLTKPSLELFIAAFRMREADAETLRRMFDGAHSTVVIGHSLPIPALHHQPRDPGYETRSLHEVHVVGDDGLPVQHRTSHVIRAVTSPLDSYLYAFDTNVAAVEVEYGGQAGEVVRLGADLYATRITLTKPLALGEIARLGYRTSLHYGNEAADAPYPEFRRAALRRPAQDINIRLQFDERKLPARIFWCQWERLEDHARVLWEEKVELSSESSVERHIDYLERAIAGFRWEW